MSMQKTQFKFTPLLCTFVQPIISTQAELIICCGLQSSDISPTVLFSRSRSLHINYPARGSPGISFWVGTTAIGTPGSTVVSTDI